MVSFETTIRHTCYLRHVNKIVEKIGRKGKKMEKYIYLCVD